MEKTDPGNCALKFPKKTDPLVLFINQVLIKKTDALAVRWFELLFGSRGMADSLDVFYRALLLTRMQPKFSENGMILRLYPRDYPQIFCITHQDAEEAGVGKLMRKLAAQKISEDYAAWISEYIDTGRMAQRLSAILLGTPDIHAAFYYIEASLQRLELKARSVRICELRKTVKDLIEFHKEKPTEQNGNTTTTTTTAVL